MSTAIPRPGVAATGAGAPVLPESLRHLYLRLFLKQSATQLLLAVPVLSYFAITSFSYAKSDPRLFVLHALLAVQAAVGFIELVKYLSMRPMLRCVRALRDGNAGPELLENAAASTFRFPLLHSLAILAGWSVFCTGIILQPFAARGVLPPIEAAGTLGLTVLTGIASMPMYYLFAEREGARFLGLPQVQTTRALQDRSADATLLTKIVLVLLAVVIYPTGVLTLLILLSNAGVLDLAGSGLGLGLLMVTTLFMSALVGIQMSTGIARPLKDAAAVAGQIAAGRLDHAPCVRSRDELGRLTGAMRNMVAYLREKVSLAVRVAAKDLTGTAAPSSPEDELGNALVQMVDSLNRFLGRVDVASDQVNSGGEQVAAASQSLSQGASEQAASLQEIGASLTEVLAGIRRIAEHAVAAKGLSRQATQVAEQGNQQMKDLVEAMGLITGSSAEIKKVVKAIDDIAFQINLLALNANVEAARAGKYGKGFAVVAEEVRSLAVRSARSVKETTEMVDASVLSTERGSELVAATARLLEDIVLGTRRSADLVDEIAATSRGHAQALDQISTGLAQIDQVTQAAAASSEESAAAAQELSAQAGELRGLVAGFAIRQDAPGRTAPKATPGSAGAGTTRATPLGTTAFPTPARGPTPRMPGRAQAQPSAPPRVPARPAGRPTQPAREPDPKELIALDDADLGPF
jgi:methyl-accepting chemotaxis protein